MDTDSQLITVVDVLPGNAWYSVGAAQLVEQSEVSTGVLGRPPRTHFHKDDFVIDLKRGTCTCPAGQVTRHRASMAARTDLTCRTSKTAAFQFEGTVCTALPGMGRTVRLHPQEDLWPQARAWQQSKASAEYLHLRVKAEHRLARLTQLGIRQARHFGRAMTNCQLYLAATVASLTQVTSQMGRTGNPGEDHPGTPTGAQWGGDNGGH